jgi:hypothetical protein
MPERNPTFPVAAESLLAGSPDSLAGVMLRGSAAGGDADGSKS